MKGIVWLASYPKSGNTWLRAFIANLRSKGEKPVNINQLGIAVASSRTLFDEIAGIEASDLTDEEIARSRPRVYRCLAEMSSETVFVKIHDAYTLLPDGAPLVPTKSTAGAIYVLRNPLDVAVSFAHHSSEPVDRIIAKMASNDSSFSAELPIRNLNQRLLSWSGHVLSWVEQKCFPVLCIRYEDMLERTADTFTVAAGFCGLPCDEASVDRALGHSSFEELQKQEREHGFNERPAGASSFFRAGKAAEGRKVLSTAQEAQIVKDHGAVMRRFGYLPDSTV